MTKTFTQADLIRYIYHETTEAEEREISNALLCDGELRARYTELCSVTNELDRAQLEPSSRTVQNILKYSGSTSEVNQ